MKLKYQQVCTTLYHRVKVHTINERLQAQSHNKLDTQIHKRNNDIKV